MDSERMGPQNTKFLIQAVHEQQGVTLSDALFDEMVKSGLIATEELKSFQAFVENNGFDSDAVNMDLEDTADSNISPLIEKQSAVDAMKTFIQSINCM